ncbi:N-acetylmuramate alpha-1-phosphate uridylyltransferase MurU [Methylibium sp.]|uniref:N-acetylmuramate alpha-1-phosphate uridylyltransferase MurU n=1 Tax=Methylibium sp. TaxID=2067992 RepID=UPI00179C7F8A|nr:nucleotidyltransferase family protein [Methylibium sp.]MBA3588172.1 nucleotidyltransferase family protein [Methylibium sp.]
MKALILAAGRGERMRPLTDHTPKPLLPVRGKPLIVWHLEALAASGVREVVINTAWLEEQFPALLGDGSCFGLVIRYSMEGRDHGGALETAGGIATALPLLQSDTFWVVGGDVFIPGFRFDAQHVTDFTARGDLAHLWLVPNPPQHPRGDFGLSPEGRVLAADDTQQQTRYTYSTVGLFQSALVAGVAPGRKAALKPCFDAAIAQGRISGSLYTGPWADVGTPERWQALQNDET